jgi:hypothetical protein
MGVPADSRRIVHLDVSGKFVAVFEVELFLAALLRRSRGDESISCGLAQNVSAELLVDKDAGPILRHPGRDSGLEGVIDHRFGGADLRCLLRAYETFPTEHPRLESCAMIEGQDIQRFVVAECHAFTSRSKRYRRIKALVELSCMRVASPALSN